MRSQLWPLCGNLPKWENESKWVNPRAECDTLSLKEALGDKLILWREKPVAMVYELFGATPDPAQREALEAFPHAPRIAMQSCTGSGKTATLSWLGWNFLLTRNHPIVGAASITADNLKANLWAELSRWYGKSELLKEMFEVQKTQIISRHHPNTWKMEARAFAKTADAATIANTFRGLHAKFVMWLLDETGGYPEAVLPTCEAIFSGEPAEAHIVQAGNPTNLSGPLYFAAGKGRRHWLVIEITADPEDPRRTPRVSIEHARTQIELYGRDNPWVLVNIFGKFPPSSINALIGVDEVSAAMKRFYRAHEIGNAAKVLGVDVARQGDDASVIALRQGIQAFPFRKYRNIDSTQGSGAVSRLWKDWGAHACFVDNTGGFGSGWVDQLRLLGRSPIGVQFAGQAHEPKKFYNKRTEMYWDAVEWIRRGGALPENPELLAALTQTTYTYKGDRLILEEKDQIKLKLGYSPDDADAFCLCFAEPVTVQPIVKPIYRPQEDWNPFAERVENPAYSAYSDRRDDYDPFR